MKNLDVRQAIQKAGLKHWQVAEAAGISQYTLCVWLRSDLSNERRLRVMNHYENIPVELKKLNQWVCTRGDSKVPMKAWENEAASSVNSQTWADFDTAHKSVSEGYYDYCGFVFNDNGFVGVDIDTGYDEDGLLSPLAADIIGKCRSYTEKSKSGRGFHILLRGDLPFKGKNNLAGVEIYKSSRYFIMTGDTLLFRTIEENQSAIEYTAALKKDAPDVAAKYTRTTESRHFLFT